MTPRRRHEIREAGRLIAVIEIIDPLPGAERPAMIELAADVGGAAYRVRIFPAVEDIAGIEKPAHGQEPRPLRHRAA